jgi:lipopolysaccharide biosynthesis glycosyltransferase
LKTAVVLASDRAYSMPLCVMLRSVDSHLGDPQVPILVVSPDLTARELSDLGGVVSDREVKLVPTDHTRLERLPIRADDWRSASVYLTLMIPDLVDAELDQVLYLDCDMLAEDDLLPLLATPLGDAPLAAVRDWHSPHLGSNGGVGPWRALGLDPRLPSMNAGALVVNLGVWRARGITQQTLDFVATHHDAIRLYDQEALNAVTAGEWTELDPRWNVQASAPDVASCLYEQKALDAAFTDPAVQHFIGPYKPWHLGPSSPRLRRWFEVLDQTKYAGWRPSATRRRLRAVGGRIRASLGALRG